MSDIEIYEKVEQEKERLTYSLFWVNHLILQYYLVINLPDFENYCFKD